MVTARDFYGYTYDMKHPAFAEFVTGNPLDADGIKKFVYHIATGRLLDADDLDAQAAEVGYVFSKNERREDEAWLWKKAQIATPFATAAIAGHPGAFNGKPPADLAAAQGIRPVPSTPWVDGQYVILGDGSEAYWNGTEWVEGIPPIRAVITIPSTFTVTRANGLAQIKGYGAFTIDKVVAGRMGGIGPGATGGRTGNAAYVPGGGGAGELYDSGADFAFPAGNYNVALGLGGASYGSGNVGPAAGKTVITTPTEVIDLLGGGAGASQGTGNTTGFPGGCGGGGRGGDVGQSNNPGTGVGAPGGYNGGQGFPDANSVLRSSGGGGGVGGPGTAGTSGVAGQKGPGVTWTWGTSPIYLGEGGAGLTGAIFASSPDATSPGSGTAGSIYSSTAGSVVGKGGDGYFQAVWPEAEVNIVSV